MSYLRLILPDKKEPFLNAYASSLTKIGGIKANSIKMTCLTYIDQLNKEALGRTEVFISPGFIDQKIAFDLVKRGFSNYLLDVMIHVSEGATNAVDTTLVFNEQDSGEMEVDESRAVPMKTKDFFTLEESIYKSVQDAMVNSIEKNVGISINSKLFLKECVRYVGFLMQDMLFTQKPIDFLYGFFDDKCMNQLNTLLYCVYDWLYTRATLIRLKQKGKRYISQQIEIKKRFQKRPKHFAVVYKKDGLTFTSGCVSELLLQYIEKSVLRCSSLTKVFLLTEDESVFYKYCLIGGRVCLKRIRDKTVSRI